MAQPQIDRISVGVRVASDNLQGVDPEMRDVLIFADTVRKTISKETLAAMTPNERLSIERLSARIESIGKKEVGTA